MGEYNSIEDIAIKIENELLGVNNEKALTLLYAFNSTGKTRISNILKDNENEKNICFNSFITDLFVWDNEELKLKIEKNSWVVEFIEEQGCQNTISDNFQNLVTSKLEPYFDLKNGTITFNIPTGDEKSIKNIKISKGEESLFIWSVFYTIISIAIDELNSEKENRSTNIFDELQYIIIDDPISSVDDSRAITMAMQLIDLIDNSNSNLKFIVTTHYALLFNVLYNNYKRMIKNRKMKIFKYILKKEENIYCLEEQRNDTPFSYHLTVKKIIEDAIKNNALKKYHFNLFRSLLEKTSNFLGYEYWTDCINNTQKDEFIKIINLYSHSRLSEIEYSELTNEDKVLFIETFNNFKKDFKWKD